MEKMRELPWELWDLIHARCGPYHQYRLSLANKEFMGRYRKEDTICGMRIPFSRRSKLLDQTYPSPRRGFGYVKGLGLTFVQVRDYECKFVCRTARGTDEALLHSLRFLDDMWRDRVCGVGRPRNRSPGGLPWGYKSFIGPRDVITASFEKAHFEPSDMAVSTRKRAPGHANKGMLEALEAITCQEYGTLIGARRSYRDPVLKLLPRFEEKTVGLIAFVVSCEPMGQLINHERQEEKLRAYVPTFDVRRTQPYLCQRDKITDLQIATANRQVFKDRGPSARWL